MPSDFDIVAIGQRGRLAYEAVLLAASLRAADPGFPGRLIIAEPQPGPLWPGDPRMEDAPRAALADMGAQITPFASRVFGHRYPHGNKAEALAALDTGRPFLFLDTDTLITGALSALTLDFDRPTASMNRSDTWPKVELYGPDRRTVWAALYDRFGLDMAGTLDPAHPPGYWQHFLYFNAGWFLGPDPAPFGARMVEVMRGIEADPPEPLACQPLYPWLDQVALPLVIHEAGGGRPSGDALALDGDVACHWRVLPLFYARESEDRLAFLETVAAPNRIKKVLKDYVPFRRMIYHGRGRKARALFADGLPSREDAIRRRLKAKGFWER